jgi:hypothetical protein
MSGMRALLVAALVSLALVAAGCGSARSSTGGAGDRLGSDAAKLVPADALALVAIDTDQSSEQAQRLDALTRDLPVRAKLLATITKALRAKGLDYARDVKPALGPEVDVAVLKIENGKPDAIALARPDDQSKLEALATKFDTATEHYTVQRVGDWSVVADSPDAFAAVRAAEKGNSLADASAYSSATDALPADMLARVFVTGRTLAQLPAGLRALVGTGSRPDWIAASIAADDNALTIRLAKSPAPANRSAGSNLIGEVPSGAMLAVCFRGHGVTPAGLRQMAGGKLQRRLGLSRADVAALASGPGVLYASAGALLPVFGLELRPKDPDAALAALRKVATKLQGLANGALVLVVRREGGSVFLADSKTAIDDLRGSGPKLVDDPPFKDAVDAAGGGTAVAYADVQQLLPFVQSLGQLVGAQVPKELLDSLDQVGTVVAVARRSNGVAALDIRVAKR